MALARACVRCSAPRAPPPAPPAQRAAPAPARLRRAAVGAFAGALLLLPAQAPPAGAVDFVFATPEAVEGLQRRDDAMQFKCKGGMMDCDGDRRDYARKQTEKFVARVSGAPGETIKEGECKVEEACTKDILGAAFQGLSGLSSAEKLEKMGLDSTAMVNSTGYVAPDEPAQ